MIMINDSDNSSDNDSSSDSDNSNELPIDISFICL